MSSCGGKGRWTVHTPESWRGSFAGRLVAIEDRGREIESRLGMRPYQVTIVSLRWSGGRRGDGVAEILQEAPVLPTPKITDLSGVQVLASPAQIMEVGQILVTGISGSYTEDQLAGRTPSGEPIGADEEFFWEITFLAGCGPGAGERRRFTVRGPPGYNAERAEWTLMLVKAQENRARSGTLR